jgi:pimeloyl-ACP methyl ester carboxylesterase
MTANVSETVLSTSTVSYRAAGDTGPTLLQIHGLGTGHRNFDLLTPHLAPHFRVIDIDLPGYGSTTPLTASPSIAGHARRVAEFIEAMAVQPTFVHGTSMGGLVAMTLAADRPELVSRLVITCSFGRLDNAMRAMQQSWKRAATVGPRMLAEVTSVQGFSRAFWDRPDAAEIQAAFVGALESSSTDDFVRDIPLMDDLDLGATVSRIRAKTLLLGADEDQMTPLQTSPSGLGMTDLAALIPTATLKVLESCGHFISIEKGTETAAEITAFLLGAPHDV